MPFKVSYPLRLKIGHKDQDVRVSTRLLIYFILDASASMIRSLQQTIEVVKACMQRAQEKDKAAVITFYNKDMFVLQEPPVSLTRAQEDAESGSPVLYSAALALDKVLRMIKVESIS